MDSSDRLPKHLLIGFGLALVVYAVFFSCDQHLRQHKGPWEVRFGTNELGFAQIEIAQPVLGISHVMITFAEDRASSTGQVLFDQPRRAVPFGRVKFEDLTYLPGSVAFDFFGHEVELLPRTLYLNKQEQPWISGKSYELKPEQKLPASMSYDPRKKGRRR